MAVPSQIRCSQSHCSKFQQEQGNVRYSIQPNEELNISRQVVDFGLTSVILLLRLLIRMYSDSCLCYSITLCTNILRLSFRLYFDWPIFAGRIHTKRCSVSVILNCLYLAYLLLNSSVTCFSLTPLFSSYERN